MSSCYHDVLRSLRPVEANLLQNHLAALRSEVRPGFQPLNWNSLHISAYIEDVTKAIRDFKNTLGQVRKQAEQVEHHVQAISQTLLIREEDVADLHPMEVGELYELLESKGKARLDSLQARFRDIPSSLEQIETIISLTKTRKSPLLAEYYRFWERRIYNAIVRLTVASIVTFQGLLNIDVFAKAASAAAVHAPGDAAVARLQRRRPIVLVNVTHNLPHLVMSPDATYIAKYLNHAMDFLCRAATNFQRWIDGTCREVQFDAKDEDKPPDFSYYQDMVSNQQVIAVMVEMDPAVVGMIQDVKQFVATWEAFGSDKDLWKERKPAQMSRLAERNLPVSYYDAKMATYIALAEAARKHPAVKDIGFIRVDCSPVARENER